jgi:hypothetical protein
MPAVVATGKPLRGRVFSCARCQGEVLVCIGCDRGRRYCGSKCSGQARRQALHANGKRYQSSPAGRLAHARRSRRYRQRRRERLARQQSLPPSPPSPSPSPSSSPSSSPSPSANSDASVGSQEPCAGGVLTAELDVAPATGRDAWRWPCAWCSRECQGVVRRDFPRRSRLAWHVPPGHRRGAPHGQSP